MKIQKTEDGKGWEVVSENGLKMYARPWERLDHRVTVFASEALAQEGYQRHAPKPIVLEPEPPVKILRRTRDGFTAIIKPLTPEQEARRAAKQARIAEDARVLDTALPEEVEILARAWDGSVDAARSDLTKLGVRLPTANGVRVVLTQEQGEYPNSTRYATVWQVRVGNVEMMGSRKALALSLIDKYGYNLIDKYGECA